MLFDSHFHIIDQRFPLVPNAGYLPPEFTCADYLSQANTLGIIGGAVVSGSFQQYDQSYLLAALKTLGPTYVGVTQLPPEVTDAEILALHEGGVRGIRFNVKRGIAPELKTIEQLAKRVFSLVGWHSEFYIDARDLPLLYDLFSKLPIFSIDHLGLCKEGYVYLLKLAAKGARIKATGFGRVDFDVATALREIALVNPNSLMFGTDLPSTRAKRPFVKEDIDLIQSTLNPTITKKVFLENALAFYCLTDHMLRAK